MKAQDFYSWCIEHERDNLLAEWNYERNLPIVPDKIARGSDKKVWWKCKEGHEWQAAIGYRGKFNRSCPICKGTHTLVEGINDLGALLVIEGDEQKCLCSGEITITSIATDSR